MVINEKLGKNLRFYRRHDLGVADVRLGRKLVLIKKTEEECRLAFVQAFIINLLKICSIMRRTRSLDITSRSYAWQIKVFLTNLVDQCFPTNTSAAGRCGRTKRTSSDFSRTMSTGDHVWPGTHKIRH